MLMRKITIVGNGMITMVSEILSNLIELCLQA